MKKIDSILISIVFMFCIIACSDISKVEEVKEPANANYQAAMVSLFIDEHDNVKGSYAIRRPEGDSAKKGELDIPLFPNMNEFSLQWKSIHNNIKDKIDRIDEGNKEYWTSEIQFISLKILSWLNQLPLDENMKNAKIYYLDLLVEHRSIAPIHMARALVTIKNRIPQEKISDYTRYILDISKSEIAKTKRSLENVKQNRELYQNENGWSERRYNAEILMLENNIKEAKESIEVLNKHVIKKD